jgi:hypothetical protein
MGGLGRRVAAPGVARVVGGELGIWAKVKGQGCAGDHAVGME